MLVDIVLIQYEAMHDWIIFGLPLGRCSNSYLDGFFLLFFFKVIFGMIGRLPHVFSFGRCVVLWCMGYPIVLSRDDGDSGLGWPAL